MANSESTNNLAPGASLAAALRLLVSANALGREPYDNEWRVARGALAEWNSYCMKLADAAVTLHEPAPQPVPQPVPQPDPTSEAFMRAGREIEEFYRDKGYTYPETLQTVSNPTPAPLATCGGQWCEGDCPDKTGTCPRSGEGTKPSNPANPKDIVGSDKVPLHMWPATATMLGAMALLDGALKYGRSNWRHAGVRASIYYDAAMRHLMAWFEGEEAARDSGIHHLGHALACIAIVVDAQCAGKLHDDRMTPGGFHTALHIANTAVPHVKRNHAGRQPPRHYTIKDKP